MVKGRLKTASNSLQGRGCFFYFLNRVAILPGIIFFVCSSAFPAFAGQELEYSAVTGLWSYSDSNNFPSPSSSSQALEYNTVTGLWEYSARDPSSPFFSQHAFAGPFTGLLP